MPWFGRNAGLILKLGTVGFRVEGHVQGLLDVCKYQEKLETAAFFGASYSGQDA